MINSVTLVGRLTKDPQVKVTSTNKHMLNFTIACDKKFKSGDNTPTADFINCVCWNQSADYIADYALKGDCIGVEGSVQTRSYEQDGKKVYVTEVLCDRVHIVSKQYKGDPNKPISNPGNKPQPTVCGEYIGDDDLPFL